MRLCRPISSAACAPPLPARCWLGLLLLLLLPLPLLRCTRCLHAALRTSWRVRLMIHDDVDWT